MADRPSDTWSEREGGVRRLLKRGQGTIEPGDPREQEAVTDFDRPPLAGGEKYAPDVPNGHRLTRDPAANKKSKAVSSKSAENKAVSSAAKK